jgi:hypothetical protein
MTHRKINKILFGLQRNELYLCSPIKNTDFTDGWQISQINNLCGQTKIGVISLIET